MNQELIPKEIQETLAAAPDNMPRFHIKGTRYTPNLTDWLVSRHPRLNKREASNYAYLWLLNRNVKHISEKTCQRHIEDANFVLNTHFLTKQFGKVEIEEFEELLKKRHCIS